MKMKTADSCISSVGKLFTIYGLYRMLNCRAFFFIASNSEYDSELG